MNKKTVTLNEKIVLKPSRPPQTPDVWESDDNWMYSLTEDTVPREDQKVLSVSDYTVDKPKS